MNGVIFSIKKTYAVVAVCCHTTVLFLPVNSLELVSIPGLIQGESDIVLWKLKCLWKELLIFDQLESPCYWLWLHKCTTLITAFNKLSFLPSHILCIVVQLIFSFLLCSPSLPPCLFMGKGVWGHCRGFSVRRDPAVRALPMALPSAHLYSLESSLLQLPCKDPHTGCCPGPGDQRAGNRAVRHHIHTDIHCSTKPLNNP